MARQSNNSVIVQESKSNRIWNRDRVQECLRRIELGLDTPGGTPFHENDPDFRAGDIIYEYSEEEIIEISKCAADVVYFADKYCNAMTDYGIRKIKLRPYQIEMLKGFQNNRFTVCLSSRQIGKTITAAIYLSWFSLFNIEKNVMVLANKGSTAAEILDKIKHVIRGLPFFLKPGIIVNNVTKIQLDNGCRIMCSATTKTAAIGYTLHLVYMDEFAHIQHTYLESFYRSVYPTISSSKISRIIITSTPNGQNKFYEIYNGAIEKKNEYFPIRVDWYQVPGRDEEWKRKEIANLGSEELFNQEYGNQFLAGDKLLLSGDSLKAMERISVKYKQREIEEFEDLGIDYSSMRWHPKFDLDKIDLIHDRFIFSIDIADGIGKDYSVINIFQVQPMSKVSIKNLAKDRVVDESKMFRIVQVGVFRCNTFGADDLSKIARVLVFKIFSPDIVRIALEMNFKGDYFVELFSKNDDYYEDIFLHTKHSEKSRYATLGIKMHTHNKMFFCRELRKLVLEKRIVLNEETTFKEMKSFGINSRGSYSSQTGNDDIAMSSVNVVPLLFSDTFGEIVEDLYETVSDDIKKTMQIKLSETDNEHKPGDDSLMYLKDLM